MGIALTVELIAAFVALALFCGWRGARPPDPRRGPRLAPWRLLMAVSAVGAVFLAAHLLNLLGLQTG